VHRTEQLIQRSRFITTVARAATSDDAHAFVRRIREEFADATHNCWAFVAGPPGSSGQVGMSDDGEPHGTAGRPMLTTLLHSGVGEIVAVVTRYYGGVKLGKGGLGRAYSGGVVNALETLPRSEKVDRVEVTVRTGHAHVPGARRVFERLEATLLDEVWGQDVTYRLGVPRAALEALKGELGELTRGQAEVRAEP
jgi:uncharacterized YigZ family protein